MSQHDMFDAEAAEAAAAEGIRRAAIGNAEWTRRFAYPTLVALARFKPTVTSEDVWRHLQDAPRPREPRAMGAVFREAAKRGVIRSTGQYRKGTRVVAHGAPVLIWESLVYGG